MTTQYEVCGACSVVLANGDDSHVARGLDVVHRNVESLGLVAHVEHVADTTTFTCDICERGRYGEHDVFEAATRTPSDNRP